MAGNLYKRGATFYARIQINGIDERRSLRTGDRKEARARLKAMLEEAEGRRAGIEPPATHTWQDAVIRFTDTHLPGLRPGAAARYRVTLRQLDPHFAGRDIATLARADAAAYVQARMKAGASQATVKRDLDVLAMVIEGAIEAEWLPDDFPNPAHRARKRLKERREPPSPIPLRWLASLAKESAKINPSLAALWRFLARTGCRQEEAGGLEWGQVDLARGEVTFLRTKTRAPRTIKVKPQVVRDLRRLKRQPHTTHVFLNRGASRFGNLPGRWRDCVARLPADGGGGGGAVGVPARHRCHDLRHTFAIRSLQQGRDIYDLSRHLGHSSVKTTEVYLAWLRRPSTITVQNG